MTTTVGGVALTAKQLERLKEVFSQPGLVAARKRITLYKSSDESLALFRTKAANMLVEISARGVASRPLKVDQARYVNQWLCDGNDMFRVFFSELNKALGYDFIQGA